MFSSASVCVPNSQVSVSFSASRDQVLDISQDVTVDVNGIAVTARPINITTGQTVTATVTSPPGYLEYQFFQYSIDGQTNHFAVVNKNNYQPTVKPVDSVKRWFNYNNNNIKISYYGGLVDRQYPLGFGKNIVDIASSHIILDHVNDAVGFYGNNGSMITRVPLPAGPVEYRKFSYTIPQTEIVTTEALILCTNNKLYRIRFDNQYFGSDTFTPTILPVIFLGNLWFEADLPTGETFIEANRKRRLSKLAPALTALDVSDSNIWVAGYDSIFILNTGFQFVKEIKINEYRTIVAIAAIGNDAIVTTRSGEVVYVSYSGDVTLLYDADAIGTPSSINNRQAVAVPDSNNQRILVFEDATGSYSIWPTIDFVPSYAREFDNSLWVTGHDNNIALQFESPTSIKKFEFDYKVTLVSVVDSTLMGVNYLQDYVTLDLTGVEKIIPISFSSRRGPTSHIGSDPIKVVSLGQEDIYPKSSPGLTCWVNGAYGQTLKTGDYVGISYRSQGIGNFRSAVVIGDRAFDYDVEVASANNFISRNFTPEFVSSQDPNTTTVQIFINQTIDPSANVLISSTYGYLSVNNASYYGQSYITENSLITLTLPFNDSLRIVAPIVSIDSHQIAIPMRSTINSQQEADAVLFKIGNNYFPVQANILIDEYITVPISDTYYIPDYYRTELPDIEYFLMVEGSEVAINKGQNHDFMAGDTLLVKNILTSSSIYDTRDAIVLGSLIVQSSWKTDGPGLIDNITFDTLVSPYQSNSEYYYDGVTVYDDGYRLYESSPALITSGTLFDCNLYVSTYGSSIVVNNSPTSDYWAINVPTGTNITLVRDVYNLLQKPIDLYQVLYDNLISSNVYVKIGTWDIQNQQVYGSDLLSVNLSKFEIQNKFESKNTEVLGKSTQTEDKVNSVISQKLTVSSYIQTESLQGNIVVDQIPDNAISFTSKISPELLPWNYLLSLTKVNSLKVIPIPFNYSSTTLQVSVKVDTIPTDYKSTTINGFIENNELLLNYKSTTVNGFVINNELPINYKSTTVNGFIDNNELPLNYKTTCVGGFIDNNELPLNYKTTSVSGFIDNNELPLNYKTTSVGGFIDNNELPSNYKTTSVSGFIDNNELPVNYKSTSVTGFIDNNELPVNYKSTSDTGFIDNSELPVNY